MELLIVSGLSGAGKSVAMNALEDIGFFCIDNVPAGLLPSITAFSKAGDNQLERVALSMAALILVYRLRAAGLLCAERAPAPGTAPQRTRWTAES